MPINRTRYPMNWSSEIVPRILNRAKNLCENCFVLNKKYILRGTGECLGMFQDDNGNIFDEQTSQKISENYFGAVDDTGKKKIIRIVLTVAHLDHNLDNNSDENLKALCQKCHFSHDKIDNLQKRKKTNLAKKGQLNLFHFKKI